MRALSREWLKNPPQQTDIPKSGCKLDCVNSVNGRQIELSQSNISCSRQTALGVLTFTEDVDHPSGGNRFPLRQNSGQCSQLQQEANDAGIGAGFILKLQEPCEISESP
jgi:hypothetical protein